MEIPFALLSGSKKCCWNCSLRLGKCICYRFVWEGKHAVSFWPRPRTSGGGGLPFAVRRSSQWWSYKHWQILFLTLGHSLTCYACIDSETCNKTTVCSVNHDACLLVKAGKSMPLSYLLRVMGWWGHGKKMCVTLILMRPAFNKQRLPFKK